MVLFIFRIIESYGWIFGLLVFYLFGPLDLDYRPRSINIEPWNCAQMKWPNYFVISPTLRETSIFLEKQSSESSQNEQNKTCIKHYCIFIWEYGDIYMWQYKTSKVLSNLIKDNGTSGSRCSYTAHNCLVYSYLCIAESCPI